MVDFFYKNLIIQHPLTSEMLPLHFTHHMEILYYIFLFGENELIRVKFSEQCLTCISTIRKFIYLNKIE